MRSNKKVIIIVGIITIIIFTSIIVNNIFLKEENKTKIIKQKNTIGIIVEGEEQEEFPSKQDYEFEKAVCNGVEVEASDTGTDSFNINISGISATSNCVFYFIEAFEYTETFTYSSDSEQEWNVPHTGTYKIELWGASGNYVNSSVNGGYGGYTYGEIVLNKNDNLYFYIGENVGNDSALRYSSMFNSGSIAPYSNSTINPHYSASGGGATDMRLINGAWNNLSSLESRIMVAGGGGGSWYNTSTNNAKGGNGGGLEGEDTIINKNPENCVSSSPATQIGGGQRVYNSYTSAYCNNNSSGSFGIGGNGCTSGSSPIGGGGGGGYYGGSAGTHASGYCASSGGGGSSYISGHKGCVAIQGSEANPSAPLTPRTGTGVIACTTGINDQLCSVHYSGKVFANTKMIDGSGLSWTNVVGTAEAMPNPLGGNYPLNTGHTGNGYVRITYIR